MVEVHGAAVVVGARGSIGAVAAAGAPFRADTSGRMYCLSGAGKPKLFAIVNIVGSLWRRRLCAGEDVRKRRECQQTGRMG